MRVLGIDPGTATTGYGVVEDDGGGLTPIAFGVVTTPADLPMPARLLLLHEQLGELIALHKPETAGVESLFFQKKNTGAHLCSYRQYYFTSHNVKESCHLGCWLQGT